jgi:hypothetical protein
VPSAVPRRARPLSRLIAIVSGVYAIACVPAILLLEGVGRDPTFFHVTQLVAIVICVVASIRDIWAHRHGPADAFFYLAVAVLLLGLGWIGFTLIVIFTHMG